MIRSRYSRSGNLRSIGLIGTGRYANRSIDGNSRDDQGAYDERGEARVARTIE